MFKGLLIGYKFIKKVELFQRGQLLTSMGFIPRSETRYIFDAYELK